MKEPIFSTYWKTITYLTVVKEALDEFHLISRNNKKMPDITVVQNSTEDSGQSSSFIHLFNKYLLSTYYVLDNVLGSEILQ